MRNDRIILALIILTFSTSGLLAWHLFAPEKTQRAPLSRAHIGDKLENPTISTTVAPPRNSFPVPISIGQAVSATNSAQKGKVVYYNPETGMVSEVEYTGRNHTTVSSTNLPGFIRTIWSPAKTEVISEFSPFRFKYFSYTTKQSATFGTGVQSVAFSPDGTQIVYFTKDSQGAGIYLATPDNKTSKNILSTRFSKVSVAWPREDSIALTVRDDLSGLDSLFSLTPAGKLTKIAEGLTRVESVWSRDGSKALISSFSQDGVLTLTLYASATGELVPLSVEARASQCTWSTDAITAFCAVSETPISSATVENASKTLQDVYEINTSLKTKELLFSSGNKSSKIFISEIFLSPAEDYLLFVNGFDEQLYSFRL